MNPGGDLEIPLNTSQTEALRLRIFETVIHSCPAHFFIAFAANGADAPAWITAWKAAAGRGLDRENARQAAIFEAVERASTMTGGPDDPRARDSRTPPEGAIPAESLWQYSADQLLKLYANKNFSSLHGCGKPVDNLWMEGIHLTRGTRHPLPATAVLLDEDARLGLGSPFTSSTGTAARDDLDAATRHALMERVERDAVAIWWYNRLLAPRIAPEAAREALPDALASWLADRRRVTWHLLLPHDLPAATVVALSARTDGTRPAIGAAAVLDPARAVLAATLEMLQGEIALAQMRAAAPAPEQANPLLAWSETTDALALHDLRGDGEAPLPATRRHDDLLDALDAAGIDVYVADLTRPELGVPVARAVSPHLRDWLPRFAPGRLADVPVALGLRRSPATEKDFNPVPFVI